MRYMLVRWFGFGQHTGLPLVAAGVFMCASACPCRSSALASAAGTIITSAITAPITGRHFTADGAALGSTSARRTIMDPQGGL